MRNIVIVIFTSVMLAAAGDVAAADLKRCELQAETDTTVPCLLPANLDALTVTARLAGATEAWWREGDVFYVVAKRSEPAELCCTFPAQMERIAGTDLWTSTIRAPRLDEAVVDVLVFPPMTEGPLRPEVWRGPLAPAAPVRTDALTGSIHDETFDSTVMGEPRRILVYRPPGIPSDQTLPVIYLADGSTVAADALIVEALIQAKAIPPVMLVGLRPGPARPRVAGDPDWRGLEYLFNYGPDRSRFDLHDRFLTEEILPLIESRFNASPRREDRLLAGRSNGGAWALEAARRHPDIFASALVMSGAGGLADDFSPLRESRVLLAVGAYDSFLELNRSIAAQAQTQGASAVTIHEFIAGHSSAFWDDALAWGLIRLLDAPGD